MGNYFKANLVALGQAVPNFANVDLVILVVRCYLEGVSREDKYNLDNLVVSSSSLDLPQSRRIDCQMVSMIREVG